MHHLQLTISGRVQGVGYRHFIQVEATRLGLRGTVRNLPDGDVEVIAEGTRERLEQLVERARRGPTGARVTDIAAQWGTGPGRYTRFGYES
jgi:acylphosphatase